MSTKYVQPNTTQLSCILNHMHTDIFMTYYMHRNLSHIIQSLIATSCVPCQIERVKPFRDRYHTIVFASELLENL